MRRAFEREVRARLEEAESVALAGTVPDAKMARRRRFWLMCGHVNAIAFLGSVVGAQIAKSQGVHPGLLVGGEILFGALSVLSYLGANALARLMERRESGKRPQFLGVGYAERMIGTRVMNWLFRVAGRGLTVPAQNEPPARERTEVLLAAAVSDVFARLPAELQARFAGVPGAAKRLEVEVERLRRRQESSAPSSLEDRMRIRERLATAVAALESLRLDVLRLESGIGSPTDLTAHLDRARAIGDAVDAQIRAVADVQSVVRDSR